ncbi:MAG: hypothetical protein QM723_17590 [Myxococcaceae bacterium]
MNPRLAELLNHTLDSGESREAIQIFADALLEAASPYGDFIVRTLRGETEQATELRKRNERHWLGPLRPFLGSTEYRSGLLHGAVLNRDSPEDDGKIDDAIAHPMLGALRRLSRERSPMQRLNRTDVVLYLKFICAPGAKRLQEVDGSDPVILEALIDGAAPAVTALSDVRLNRETLDKLSDQRLDRIEHLEVTATRSLQDVLDRLESATAFKTHRRSVRVFHQGFGAQQVIGAWSRLNLTALEVYGHELRRTADGTMLTLRSTATLLGYAGEANPDPYWASLLAEQVRDLRRVVFDGPQPLADTLRAAREILPAVQFVMADGSEAVGRVAPAPPPPPLLLERPAELRPEIPPQPVSDPDGVTTLILRGDIAGATEEYRKKYVVGADVAERKVKELQKLLRPPSTYF